MVAMVSGPLGCNSGAARGVVSALGQYDSNR